MYVLQVLAFLPIVMGVLMFLFEFFEDQALAFMVFFVVWLSQVFGMVCVCVYVSQVFGMVCVCVYVSQVFGMVCVCVYVCVYVCTHTIQ